MELEHSWCRHCSNGYSRGPYLVESLPHIEGSKTFLSILNWILLGVVIALMHTREVHHLSNTYHTSRTARPSLRHELELSCCRRHSIVYPKGNETFPSTLYLCFVGVVTTPKYTPEVHIWSKAYHTTRVATPSLRHFIGALLVSLLHQSTFQRYISV